MKPYSKDLRLRVLAAVDRRMPRKEVVRVFGVSEPTVRRYLRLRRETGDVEPKPPTRPPAPNQGRGTRCGAARSSTGQPPSHPQREHCELLEDESGMRVSASTMSRAFGRLGLPLKKRHS